MFFRGPSVRLPDMRRQFRELVRAVIEHQGHFLLARARGAGNTFLPGGHIEPFERLSDTLRRELHEEMGLHPTHFEYLGVLENEFMQDNTLHVERCHLFRAHCPDLQSGQSVPALEPHLEFLWATPQEFAQLNLLPAPIRQLLPRHSTYTAWHHEGDHS